MLSAQVYTAAVARGLRSGTTTCSWFSTLHLESAKLLVQVVRAMGQRAHVGKVCRMCVCVVGQWAHVGKVTCVCVWWGKGRTWARCAVCVCV